MIEERCELCRFWKPGSLECRRHAPSIALFANQFPVIGPQEWCGDFVELRPHDPAHVRQLPPKAD
jgi:hypothetical protein